MPEVGTLMLSWNEYDGYLSRTLKHMWEDRILSDVTLTTKDDKQIKVHRVILFSTSIYFQNIFLSNAEKDQIILENIEFEKFEVILRFAYLGSCEIEEDALENFLGALNYLEINFLPEDICIKSSNQKQYDTLQSKDTLDIRKHNMFECDQCDKKYYNKSHLKDHKHSNHDGIRDVECDQCEFKTFRRSSLKLHQKSKHE